MYLISTNRDAGPSALLLLGAWYFLWAAGHRRKLIL